MVAATAVGAATTVGATAAVVAPGVASVGLGVAFGEGFASSVWHLRLVALSILRLLQLVHSGRSLLYLAGLH